MEQEQIEFNKLCAEFLGYKREIWPAEERIGDDTKEDAVYYYTPEGYAISEEELQFHEDWNWLHHVIEVIESLGPYGFTIYRKTTNINGLPFEIANTRAGTKKEAVIQSIKTFITFYNDTRRNTTVQ